MTKHPIYGLLLLVYLFVVIPAYAAEEENLSYDTLNDWCQDLAYRAERSAELRDAGARWELFEEMIQAHPEKYRDLYSSVYASVFRYPKLSPREEGNNVMAECMGAFD